jgi:hypothetical protein
MIQTWTKQLDLPIEIYKRKNYLFGFFYVFAFSERKKSSIAPARRYLLLAE